MIKTILAALTAATFALPASAQTIDIDDDGWSFVDAPAVATTTVDIDDDGWKRVDLPFAQAQVSRAVTSANGTCSQLELSAGVSPEACGTLSMNELAFLQGDD